MFLDLLYSAKVEGVGLDKLCWRPSIQRGFEVCSYHRVLAPSHSDNFPCQSIWKLLVPSKVAFYLWVAAFGNSGEPEEVKHYFGELVLYVQEG